MGSRLKIVTKRLVTRRKTPCLDNPDPVKYIVRSLFPHVEPFKRQDQSSCVGGEVFRRLEEAEVGPAEEGQQASRGCLIV